MASKRSRGRPPHPDVLTPAEWGVVEGVRHGMTNAEIARRRGVSLDAVKQHVAAAREKVGVDDRPALVAWTGVRADSPLHGRRPDDMETSLELGPIGQVSRSVADIGEAVRFYGEVLGLPHLYTFGDLAFFDLGGVRLYLQAGEAGPESVLYLRAADIHAAHAALEARGVEFLGAPHLVHRHADGMEEWMAFFADPEGRTLALMAQVRPQS